MFLRHISAALHLTEDLAKLSCCSPSPCASFCHFSDVLVQIVDARNPLLFRCEDLERYVHEVDAKKKCMVLVNKADFLSEAQR